MNRPRFHSARTSPPSCPHRIRKAFTAGLSHAPMGSRTVDGITTSSALTAMRKNRCANACGATPRENWAG